MDQPRRDSRQHNGITLPGLSQPTFATKSARNGHTECVAECLLSSFDGDRQSGSYVIERNRDKLSTRKFDVGVFTQAGPIPEVGLRAIVHLVVSNSGHPPNAKNQRSSDGSDASRVDTAVRGDVVDFAARSADIH
jgi:hypothetical protein